MLYHIDDSDRKLLLGAVNAMLTDDGKFIASTIGKNHMKEIFELAYEYDKNVKAPEWFSRGFILENGKEQLDEFFSDVTMFYHDNNLLIPDWRVIYDYLLVLGYNYGHEMLNNLYLIKRSSTQWLKIKNLIHQNLSSRLLICTVKLAKE